MTKIEVEERNRISVAVTRWHVKACAAGGVGFEVGCTGVYPPDDALGILEVRNIDISEVSMSSLDLFSETL
jgi:hypothetical protein